MKKIALDAGASTGGGQLVSPATTDGGAERPILFSALMVEAILGGEKSQTRRAMRGVPPDADGPLEAAMAPGSGALWNQWAMEFGGKIRRQRCPYGKVGDRLWVRETWWHYKSAELEQAAGAGWTIARLGDGTGSRLHENPDFDPARHAIWTKRPSIFMPRWASRISLVVTGVRVERLHAITERETWAEGIAAVDGALDEVKIMEMAGRMKWCIDDARSTFAALWVGINGLESWDSNPWVWVIEFKRIESAPPPISPSASETNPIPLLSPHEQSEKQE